MRFRRGRIQQKKDNHPKGIWGQWIQYMKFKIYGPDYDEDEDDYKGADCE